MTFGFWSGIGFARSTPHGGGAGVVVSLTHTLLT